MCICMRVCVLMLSKRFIRGGNACAWLHTSIVFACAQMNASIIESVFTMHSSVHINQEKDRVNTVVGACAESGNHFQVIVGVECV